MTITVFAGVAIGLLGVRVIAIDGHETPFAGTRFDGEHVAGVGQSLDANFSDQLVLIGLDAPSRQMPADGALPLTLYWRAQNVPAVDESSTLQVLDEQGNLWGQSDSQNPGGLPTSRWTTAEYARDVHRLRLRPGTPPGQYRLVAGVYQAGGAALAVLDADRVPQGQSAALGTLSVTRAQRPAADLGIAQPANVALGPLTYLGGSLSSASPQAGDDLIVELFWRAESAQRPDVSLHLALTSGDGSALAAWDLPPARADYPTSLWAPGEIVRGVARLRVPATAPAGQARLELSLPGAKGSASPATIATLTLRVPARSFAVPPMGRRLNARLGPAVTLLGYDLDASGVTLYWQAVSSLDTGYSVFVHALDSSGAITAQVDRPPLNGLRPTTGWLPGEVLTDRYALPLGEAQALEVGLYDPTTGQRLGTVTIALRYNQT
jgi:hypothetical protein